jgi:hypothetical protein
MTAAGTLLAGLRVLADLGFPFVLALAMVGTFSMAFVQFWKDLFQSRASFFSRRLQVHYGIPDERSEWNITLASLAHSEPAQISHALAERARVEAQVMLLERTTDDKSQALKMEDKSTGVLEKGVDLLRRKKSTSGRDLAGISPLARCFLT